MIPAGQHLKMTVTLVGVETQTLLDKMHVTPPSGRDGGHQLEYIVILVAALEQTQITVDAGYEAVYLILTAAETEGGECLIGAAQRPVVGIDTVYLDMNAQERDTLTPVLAVELTRVHLTAHSLQATPELRQHGEYHSLILGADNDIIHKTDIVQPTLIDSPVVQFIQIVVHGVLPDQVTDGTAYAGRFLKQALALWNIHPLPYGCAAGAVPGGIGEDGNLQDVVELVKVITVVPAFHQILQDTESIVLAGVGKVALQIHLDIISRAGIPTADVIHILDNLIHGRVLTVALSVVIGPVGQLILYERPHADIKVVMEETQRETAGKDLTRSWIAAYEGIGGRPEGMIVYVILYLEQVPLPVQLKLNRVGRAAFVLAGAQHSHI